MSSFRFLYINVIIIAVLVSFIGCGCGSDSESVSSSGILGKLPSIANDGVSKITDLEADLKSASESNDINGYAETKKEIDEVENSCETEMTKFISETKSIEVPCFEEGDNGKFTLKNVIVKSASLGSKHARLGMVLNFEAKADYPRETYFSHGYFIDSKDQVIGERVVFASNRGEVKQGQIVELNGYYDGLEKLGDAVKIKIVFGNPYEK